MSELSVDLGLSPTERSAIALPHGFVGSRRSRQTGRIVGKLMYCGIFAQRPEKVAIAPDSIQK